MKEVVFLHVGQCGNNIGAKFWEIISEEHGLNEVGDFKGDSDLQLNKIDICYRQSSGERFVPRAIMIDLDPSTINIIKNSKYGALFHPDNFISSNGSTGNNFAKGYYTDGSDILDNIMDIIRKEIEYCDGIQAFQMFQSLGGGTGSGVGSLLYNKINEEYADRIRSTASVFPTPKHSETITESYNALLSIDLAMINSSLVSTFDNKSIMSLINKSLRFTSPTMGDINHLISMIITSMSTNLRFTGQLSSDYRKLSMNLIPFPRFVFLINSFAPMVNRLIASHAPMNVHSMMMQALDCHNVMVRCDPRKGKYIAASTLCRGKMSIVEIENEILNFQNKNSNYFVDWIPNNIKISLCDIPPRGTNMTMALMGNSTSLDETFNEITSQYSFMFRRRAFIHWYTSEGLEEEEFHLAEDNVLDLIDDYQRVSVNTLSDP